VDGTVSVLTARPALAALDRQGTDAEVPLRMAGLSRAALDAVDHRLPYESVHRFWEAAADAAQDRYFAVHVAEELPAGELDLIDYLISVSANVGECFSRLTHYVRLIYDHSDLHLAVEPRCARLARRLPTPAPQYDEFSLTMLLVRSRQFSATNWSPTHVTFQHAARDEGGELARVLRCPVIFSAKETELLLASEILAVPHVRADSRLLAILVRYADSLLTAFPARGNLVARTRSAIARQLARALPTLPSTAGELHMPERTLQRMLAQTGDSYSSLFDEVRRGLALKQIREGLLSVAEVAYMLHFSDATSFHHTFKRWTGQTPLDYRRQLLAEGRAPAEARRAGRSEGPQ
jgi:AraC-like DNA-binding protein